MGVRGLGCYRWPRMRTSTHEGFGIPVAPRAACPAPWGPQGDRWGRWRALSLAVINPLIPPKILTHREWVATGVRVPPRPQTHVPRTSRKS